MKAFVFPGQGSQFVGMGKELYENNPLAKELFDKADEILGFKITGIMFAGTDEQLKETKVTQPAVFLHSVISALCLGDAFKPDISGSKEGIEEACELLKAAGAKRALPLKVGGAFHSPLMQPAKDELQAAIEATEFNTPKCPVYQNVDALPHTDPAEIRKNLIAQLTSSVRWTKSAQNMIADGADEFIECGPGKALQGMLARIDRNVNAHGID